VVSEDAWPPAAGDGEPSGWFGPHDPASQHPPPVPPIPPRLWHPPPGMQPPSPVPPNPFQGPPAWGSMPPGYAAPPPVVRRSRPPRRTVFALLAVLVGTIVVTGVGAALAEPDSGTGTPPTSGSAAQDDEIRALWRSTPADDLLPSVLSREGTETYIRLAVDPDESCGALPAPFTTALSPATCDRLVQATYVDRTQTVTVTVGIVVLAGTVDNRQRLFQNWTADSYATQTAMMPPAYPVPGTVAAGYGDPQRVAWQSAVSADGTYLVYAVAGFTDGRTGPDAAARTAGSGTALEGDSPPVQVAADLPGAIQDVITAKETAALGGAG
jgi:hypothetical protein